MPEATLYGKSTNPGDTAVKVDADGNLQVDVLTQPNLGESLVDDAAFTPATSRVMPVGFEADETAPDSVDEGDIGAARMTLDRKVLVNPQPHTAGGLSIYRNLDIDETGVNVKGSAGQLYGWYLFNNAAAVRFVKFYDKATAPTVGTDTPVLTIALPAGAAANEIGTHGLPFANGIGVGAVTGVADNNTGAPAANDVVINLFYK